MRQDTVRELSLCERICRRAKVDMSDHEDTSDSESSDSSSSSADDVVDVDDGGGVEADDAEAHVEPQGGTPGAGAAHDAAASADAADCRELEVPVAPVDGSSGAEIGQQGHGPATIPSSGSTRDSSQDVPLPPRITR